MNIKALKRGDIFKTPKFNEPVRVVNDPQFAEGFVMLDVLGLRTDTFRGGVIFIETDLQHLEIQPSVASYQGDPKLFKVCLETLCIRLAYTYVPFSGLPVILVDPLPHNQKVLSCSIIMIIHNTRSNEHPHTRGNYLEVPEAII